MAEVSPQPSVRVLGSPFTAFTATQFITLSLTGRRQRNCQATCAFLGYHHFALLAFSGNPIHRAVTHFNFWGMLRRGVAFIGPPNKRMQPTPPARFFLRLV